MSILNTNQASNVLVQEINLSQVITSSAVTVACQVVVSNQGSTKPKLWTNGDSYLAEYGNPNAQISFDQYCAIDFFREGNQLWSVRAVAADAKYSAVLMYEDGGVTKLYPLPNGISDPTDPDWGSIGPSGVTKDKCLALFYPSKGQGSYGDVNAIEIVGNNPNPPVISGTASSTATTGGTLAPATYEYQLTALHKDGSESIASAPYQVVIAGPGSTNSITNVWPVVAQAIGYRVYGRTSGGMGFIMELGGGSNTTIPGTGGGAAQPAVTWTDTGAITPDATRPPPTQAIGTPSSTFVINVYDTSVNKSTPRESFVCSLGAGVDGDGTSTELEDKINPFSQYIQVTSNVPNLDPTLNLPEVDSVASTNMAGGDSGSAPDENDIINAMQVFKDTQLYGINTFMQDGHPSVAYMRAIDTLVTTRQDAIGVLDTPSASQQFQAAIDFRNLTLNLNSTYSALFCPDVLENDSINGKQLYVPMSGWIAALCARTDKQLGPGASIAGLNRGILDVLKTRYTYDEGQMTALYQAQVNYPRMFVGQGTALWEQRTLAGQESALSWLSVRRIINVIKKSLKRFLFYSLQEWNDDFTARQIITSCSQYLQAVQDSRQITGFNVTVRATAAERNSGILNVNVIIVPAIPIHIIQLNVIIAPQGVSFDEILQTVGQA